VGESAQEAFLVERGKEGEGKLRKGKGRKKRY
jgi:hypothetical protein